MSSPLSISGSDRPFSQPALRDAQATGQSPAPDVRYDLDAAQGILAALLFALSIWCAACGLIWLLSKAISA